MVSLVRCATLLLLLAVAAPTWGGERAAYRGLEGTVVRVVDGDTIHVRVGTRVEKVRYIGVNAPEVHHPTKGVEPGGREAAAVDRKSTRLNSSHRCISYAVFCLKKKTTKK